VVTNGLGQTVRRKPLNKLNLNQILWPRLSTRQDAAVQRRRTVKTAVRYIECVKWIQGDVKWEQSRSPF